MKKLFRNSNLSLKTAMVMLVTPAFIALIVSLVLLSGKVETTYSETEDLFFDNLYQINSTLINADRDLYQAMLGVMEFHDNQYSTEIMLNAELRDQLNARLDYYAENRQQAIDNVASAGEKAKENESLWTGTTLDDGTKFASLYESFTAEVENWEFDSMMDAPAWKDFRAQFETLRSYISDMSDIVEVWAEYEDTSMNSGITKMVTIVFCVFMVVVILLMLLALTTAGSLSKGIIRVSDSINVMADGNFVNPVDVSSPIKEFKTIGSAAEIMRNKLRDALLNVIASARNVNEGASASKDMITESQNTASQINNAVNDIANGATSMADDVQSTADEAGNIGVAVDSVYKAASDNMERSRKLSDESSSVQDQLAGLLKAGENTREKAGLVSDSVNETANVVAQISSSAESIISIASQTNLLALNASIEAARAGEAGKGFAVVADNIKHLAEESNSAANEITSMLSQIMQLSEQNKTLTDDIRIAADDESAALEQMNSSFDNMQLLLKDTDDGNRTIVSLVEDLNANKAAILNSVESLSSMSEEYAASTEESSASFAQLDSNMASVVDEAGRLQSIAEELEQAVSVFKVD
ncbi:MAG: methyl-accepting chemotaxis protein [Lachnospiraceae bacterium]|nr:methyl-accepting chemotaxis protein [Lachnospiraceae bacterium]